MIALIVILGVVVLSFGFWLWMLIDCATNEPAEGNNRIVWVVIIACAHIVGAIIYWIVRRDERIAQVGH